MFLNPEKIIAKEAKASVTDAGNWPCPKEESEATGAS